MITAIQKWGNSLGLRIPKGFARELQIDAGDKIDLAIGKGQLVIRPVKKAYRLDELLAEITPDNVHAEMGTGGLKGREAF